MILLLCWKDSIIFLYFVLWSMSLQWCLLLLSTLDWNDKVETRNALINAYCFICNVELHRCISKRDGYGFKNIFEFKQPIKNLEKLNKCKHYLTYDSRFCHFSIPLSCLVPLCKTYKHWCERCLADFVGKYKTVFI